MKYLLFIGFYFAISSQAQAQELCKNETVRENYGNGYRTLHTSYFKNCKPSFQEEYYYNETEILYRTIAINYRKDGTRKSFIETANGDVVNEKRYDSAGNMVFEKMTIYNVKGNITEIRTTRNGQTIIRNFPMDIYGDPM